MCLFKLPRFPRICNPHSGHSKIFVAPGDEAYASSERITFVDVDAVPALLRGDTEDGGRGAGSGGDKFGETELGVAEGSAVRRRAGWKECVAM